MVTLESVQGIGLLVQPTFF